MAVSGSQSVSRSRVSSGERVESVEPADDRRIRDRPDSGDALRMKLLNRSRASIPAAQAQPQNVARVEDRSPIDGAHRHSSGDIGVGSVVGRARAVDRIGVFHGRRPQSENVAECKRRPIGRIVCAGRRVIDSIELGLVGGRTRIGLRRLAGAAALQHAANHRPQSKSVRRSANKRTSPPAAGNTPRWCKIAVGQPQKRPIIAHHRTTAECEDFANPAPPKMNPANTGIVRIHAKGLVRIQESL